MAYRVVVPLEGSNADDEVIPYVRKFSARTDVLITLLHVVPDLTCYAREHVSEECAQADKHLREFCSQLEIQGAVPGCELRMGTAVTEILKFAALLPADLIIMPAHGRQGLERLLHGSVTEAVLRQSRCPLLLPQVTGGRPQDRDISHLFDRILVPLDGSGQSFGIIPTVVEFARSFESEVILFHDYAGVSDSGESLEIGDIDKRIRDYRALLGYAGISVSMETTYAGRPVEDILEAVSSTNADLIAMASHGRRGLERLAAGSVVEHVLRNATRPVLACNTSPALLPDIEEQYIG